MLMVIALIPRPLFAADLAVVYSIKTSDAESAANSGVLTVEVHNLSGGELQNVQLRPEGQGSISLTGGAIQLGSIAAGAVKTATSDLFIDPNTFDSAVPIFWLVNYDDAQLNNRQLFIPGNEIQQ